LTRLNDKSLVERTNQRNEMLSRLFAFSNDDVGAKVRWQPSTSSLVVGVHDLSKDPDYCFWALPWAKAEVIDAAKTLETQPLLGISASYEAVTSQLPLRHDSLRVIYFATHGISENDDPEEGDFPALTGGHLQMHDIRSFHFYESPLVILSACETGLGPFDRDVGDVVNVASAWFASGHPRLL
jgi:CHAT domain-containing protein